MTPEQRKWWENELERLKRDAEYHRHNTEQAQAQFAASVQRYEFGFHAAKARGY